MCVTECSDFLLQCEGSWYGFSPLLLIWSLAILHQSFLYSSSSATVSYGVEGAIIIVIYGGFNCLVHLCCESNWFPGPTFHPTYFWSVGVASNYNMGTSI